MNLDFSNLPPATHYPVGGPRIPIASDEFINLPESYDHHTHESPIDALWLSLENESEDDVKPPLFEEYMLNNTPASKKSEWVKTRVAIGFLVASLMVLILALGWI